MWEAYQEKKCSIDADFKINYGEDSSFLATEAVEFFTKGSEIKGKQGGKT